MSCMQAAFFSISSSGATTSCRRKSFATLLCRRSRPKAIRPAARRLLIDHTGLSHSHERYQEFIETDGLARTHIGTELSLTYNRLGALTSSSKPWHMRLTFDLEMPLDPTRLRQGVNLSSREATGIGIHNQAVGALLTRRRGPSQSGKTLRSLGSPNEEALLRRDGEADLAALCPRQHNRQHV